MWTACTVENWPEDMALKLELLGQLEHTYGDHPIIATNSTTFSAHVAVFFFSMHRSENTALMDMCDAASSLPIDELAAGLSTPGRFLGIHYMQPVRTL